MYGFNGTYTSESELTTGTGYWLNFSDSGSVNIAGTPIVDMEISLFQGWNLISGISEAVDFSSVSDPEGIIVPGTIYGFTTEGYSNTETIEPGRGYWIRANSSGSITLIDN